MKVSKIFIACLMIISLSPVDAAWTDIHQISGSSHTVNMIGDGNYQDLQNAYDGLDYQSGGDPVILRTYTCYSGLSTPSQGTEIVVDYTIATNQSSKNFNLITELKHIENNATDSYVSISLYNTNTLQYDVIFNKTDSGQEQYNQSHASRYMDNAGNILIKLITKHGNEDCTSYAEVTLWELAVYTDIASQPSTDQDNDGINDSLDYCPNGESSWSSNPTTDYDGDGCKDDSEDVDDDNDGIDDLNDECEKGNLFFSNQIDDYDSDGCEDDLEDIDNDNDGVNNTDDRCKRGLFFTSTPITDYDGDGCKDDSEDPDDDNDEVNDIDDAFPYDDSESQDYDNDSIGDNADDDDDSDGIDDLSDDCKQGERNWTSGPLTDHDGDGCKDDDSEDDNDDNDSHKDEQDNCPRGDIAWTSSQQNDYDNDGCKDNSEDFDDDDDQICDGNSTDGTCEISSTLKDECTNSALTFTSTTASDNDRDGCQDSSLEDLNDDNDEYLDVDDAFPLDNCAYLDTDEDGKPDNITTVDCDTNLIVDTDDDGDGFNDTDDAFPKHDCANSDLDGDGLPDDINGFCPELQEDDDDDGDLIEDINDKFPEDFCASEDYDSDSKPDTIRANCETTLIEDDDDDNDGVLDENDFLQFDASQQNDTDKDTFGDNTTGTNGDDCPDETYGGISERGRGCPPNPQIENPQEQEQTIPYKESESSLNEFISENKEEIIVVAGIGSIGIYSVYSWFGGLIVGFVGGRHFSEFEATGTELIQWIKSYEEHSAESESNLLAETNLEFIALIEKGEKLVEKFDFDFENELSSVKDLIPKMKENGRCEVSGAVLLRGFSTAVARFHMKRLARNGYPIVLKQNNKREKTGKQIIKELLDKKGATHGNARKLKKWLESLDDQAFFKEYHKMLEGLDELIHVEDYPKIRSYKQEEFNKNCIKIQNYVEILITHPPYPHPNRDLSVEAQAEHVYHQQS